MADLTEANIDPNVEVSTGGFTVLPAGQYKAVIVSDEYGDNKNGTGKLLTLTLQVIEGQFKGETIKDYLNITHTNTTAQAIGQGVLKNICNLCKIEFPPKDTVGLFGKPMTVKVEVKNFTSNNSGEQLQSNNVKKYSVVQPNQDPATDPALSDSW